jgi:hypothetical protein
MRRIPDCPPVIVSSVSGNLKPSHRKVAHSAPPIEWRRIEGPWSSSFPE